MTQRDPLRATFRLIALLSIALLAGLLPAQNADDYAPVRPFAITRRGGEVGFEFRSLSETQTFDGSDELEFKNRSFQEYIRYKFDGYVYHPKFLDFHAAIKLALLQQMLENNSDNGLEDEENNEFLTGYDIYLYFLKDHPFSATIYASRDESAVLELFTDRMMIENQREGISMNWKKGPFPMDLVISRNRVQEFGIDSFSETTYKTLEYTVRNNLKERMFTEFRYRFLDYDQSFHADLPEFDLDRKVSYKSHDLSLLNTIYLSEDRASYLNSTMRYYKQDGTQNLETFNWQERLDLRHTKKLRTYYLANVLKNKFETEEVRTLRGEVGLEHQLFESLRTHVDVHGRRTEFDEATEDLYGATLRFNYRKTTPFGTLTAGVGGTLDQFKRSATSAESLIIDEQMTLEFNTFTNLAQVSVIESSIEVNQTVITDGQPARVPLVEGLDYEIRTVGNRTGLRLLPGGRFSEPTAVLVTYRVRIDSDLEYQSFNREFFIRHDFDRIVRGLALYYRRQKLEALDLPEETLNILEYTDWVAGASYDWRWLSAVAEFERYHSNFSIYDQWNTRLEGHHELTENVRFGWHAGLLMIDYKDDTSDPDYSEVLELGAGLDGRFRPGGYWNVEARARQETGILDETLVGIVGKLGYRWRRVKVEAGGRIEQRERENSTRDRAQVFLQVSREFGGRTVER